MIIDLSCQKERGWYTCGDSPGTSAPGFGNQGPARAGGALRGRGVCGAHTQRRPERAGAGRTGLGGRARLRAAAQPQRQSRGPGAERGRRALAQPAPRWDTCGSWDPGASGGCSCAPRTPTQVTHSGRQGGKQQKSVWTQPLFPGSRESGVCLAAALGQGCRSRCMAMLGTTEPGDPLRGRPKERQGQIRTHTHTHTRAREHGEREIPPHILLGSLFPLKGG